MAHVEAPPDIRQRLPSLPPRSRFRHPMRRQLRLPPEPHPLAIAAYVAALRRLQTSGGMRGLVCPLDEPDTKCSERGMGGARGPGREGREGGRPHHKSAYAPSWFTGCRTKKRPVMSRALIRIALGNHCNGQDGTCTQGSPGRFPTFDFRIRHHDALNSCTPYRATNLEQPTLLPARYHG